MEEMEYQVVVVMVLQQQLAVHQLLMLAVVAVGNDLQVLLDFLVTAELVAVGLVLKELTMVHLLLALELLIQVVAVVEVLVIMEAAVQVAQELLSSDTQ
jgi:hypothetical protein